MSKIIVKKDLDLVIESTLKEAGLVSEDDSCPTCGNSVCECGTEYADEDRGEFDGRKSRVIGVDSNIKKQRMGEDSEGEETYNYGEDEGEDEKRLKRRHMSKSHRDALKKDMDYDEDHEDRHERDTHFEGTEDVVKKSLNSLSEAVVNTTNNNLIKEEMDNFNKLINYRK